MAATSLPVVVSYHYPCPDGVFAALAAHLSLEEANVQPVWVPNTVYNPRTLESLSLQVDQTLYLLDYVGPHGFARAAAEQGARVIVLDHHKTALDMLGNADAQHPNLYNGLDMARSGATIALDYFKPKVSTMLQTIYKCIEDADLWKWELPHSKAFHAGLGSLQLEYDANKNPAIFQQLCELQLGPVITQGQQVLDEQDQQIRAALRTAFTVQLGGLKGSEKQWGRCLAVQVDSKMSQIRSSLGNALAQASAAANFRAVAVVAYIEEAMQDHTKIKISLRSEGDEDTTQISQHFGGGGHRNASSFIMNISEFESWKL